VQESQALPGDAALQQEHADLIDLPPAAFEVRLEILEILNDWFATIELDCCCEITGPSNHSIGGVRWHEGWTDSAAQSAAVSARRGGQRNLARPLADQAKAITTLHPRLLKWYLNKETSQWPGSLTRIIRRM
jgi:hypothetical protein